MMGEVKILDRYIASQFVRNFLLALLILSGLILTQSLLGELLERKFPPNQLLLYHLMNLPKTAVQFAPPAVLLATVLTLSGMARFNELTACYSAGIGIKRVTTLLVTAVFILSSMVLVLEDRILPLMHKKRKIYYWHEMQRRPDFFLGIRKDKLWYRSKNMIYNLRSFDSQTNLIQGMLVFSFDDQFNLLQVTEAKRASFMPAKLDRPGRWLLQDGAVTVFSTVDSSPLTQQFQEKDLIIAETPKDFKEIEEEVDGLRLKELYRFITKMKEAGADTKSFEVKFQAKLSNSFVPIVMCILGVPFAVGGRRQGGLVKDLAACLGLTFFYWLFYSIGLSLGSNGALPPKLAAWLPSMIFAALAAVLIARRE